MNRDLLIIGRTNWREPYRQRLFGIPQEDRLQHLYVIGQTGTGKTTLLQNLIRQDIAAGRGLAFLDPHGDAVEDLVRNLPKARRDDLVYLNVPDSACDLGFNPLESVPLQYRAFAANGIIEAFRSVWGTTWGPRLEHILRNALLTLLDQPEATLADLNRLFTDKEFREQAVARVTHPATLEFWLREFASYPPRYRVEALAPVQNKLGAFLSQPPLYRLLTRAKTGYTVRSIMDGSRLFFVNLAKGRIGADGAALLGSLIVSRISLVGLSRQDTAAAKRVPFFAYLDEFHSFTTTAVAGMLSELRKYRVGLVLAHQYVAQVKPEVRDAVFGNVGSVVVFRVGPDDTRVLQRQLGDDVNEAELLRLPDRSVYVRLIVAGMPTSAFSAATLAPCRKSG